MNENIVLEEGDLLFIPKTKHEWEIETITPPPEEEEEEEVEVKDYGNATLYDLYLASDPTTLSSTHTTVPIRLLQESVLSGSLHLKKKEHRSIRSKREAREILNALNADPSFTRLLNWLVDNTHRPIERQDDEDDQTETSEHWSKRIQNRSS